jgi:hypothetical protein
VTGSFVDENLFITSLLEFLVPDGNGLIDVIDSGFTVDVMHIKRYKLTLKFL